MSYLADKMHLKVYMREPLKTFWRTKEMLGNIGQGKAGQDKAEKKHMHLYRGNTEKITSYTKVTQLRTLLAAGDYFSVPNNKTSINIRTVLNFLYLFIYLHGTPAAFSL